MEQTTAVPAPIRVPVWAWLIVAAAVTVIYVLALENGTALAESASRIHEFFHDARHFVGVPCH